MVELFFFGCCLNSWQGYAKGMDLTCLSLVFIWKCWWCASKSSREGKSPIEETSAVAVVQRTPCSLNWPSEVTVLPQNLMALPTFFLPVGLCSNVVLVGLAFSFVEKSLTWEANIETCIFASTFRYLCGKSIPVVFPQ